MQSEPTPAGETVPVPRLSVRVRRVLHSDFVGKVSQTLGTRIVLIVAGLANTVLVARALGPEGRGLTAAAAALAGIGAQLGNLGLHSANTYYVSRDRALLPRLVGNSLMVSFGAAGVIAAVVGVFMSLVPSSAPVHGALLWMALLAIPLSLSLMLLENLLIGVQDIKSFNGIELIVRFVGIALVLAVALAGATAERVYAAGLVALAIGIGTSLWRLRSHSREPLSVSRKLLLEHLSYGFRAYVAALFAFLVIRVDMLMVQYVLGAKSTGLYSVAVSMADFIYMIPVAVGTVLFPKLCAIDDAALRRHSASRVVTVLGIVLFAVSIAAALLAGPAVRLLFGAEFAAAVPAFIWLLPGVWLLGVNTIYMNYFASVGIPKVVVLFPGFALVANVIMNALLLRSLGIIGASLSSTVAYGLMLACSVYYFAVPGHAHEIGEK